ncbi:hypothetical protein BJ508DRAFT_358900 [Ascobolus immersus RN42]|uniref:Cytoplasmic tRNA 2-thiolation protein 2 n=1 Tax=Ascobolus immersus RN42 TaxID=1160509 RepID=A0A3N4II89_ASCIM|nr:hypothetical protein BJ508DRAFT_358900 [Ascobolus immersus RN42]
MSPSTLQTCKRCNEAPATTNIRTEPACPACFLSYITHKIYKHLEPFRTRNLKSSGTTHKPRNAQSSTPTPAPAISTSDDGRSVPFVLLAHSLGPCSTVMVDTLLNWRRSQIERAGRPGFDVGIVVVDDRKYGTDTLPTTGASNAEEWEKCIDAVREKWSADCNDGKNIWVLPLDSVYEDPAHLKQVVEKMSNATSRLDLVNLLRDRLIDRLADQQKASFIIYGDSTTLLAEKTLGLTAKGRGAALPSLLGDSINSATSSKPTTSTSSKPRKLYPLRDLLRHELHNYIALSPNGLAPPTSLPDRGKAKELFKGSTATATKNDTIDELMRGYFETVEEQFPSILSNVVRTAGRLHTFEGGFLKGAGKEEDEFERSKKGESGGRRRTFCTACGGDVWADEAKEDGEDRWCYGCERMLLGAEDGVRQAI